MNIKHDFLLLFLLLSFVHYKSPNSKQSTGQLSDDALMDTIQRRTFNYFWDEADPNSGLAYERIHMDGIYLENDRKIITSSGSGFGIMTVLGGIDRGYVTREAGLARMEKIVSPYKSKYFYLEQLKKQLPNR